MKKSALKSARKSTFLRKLLVLLAAGSFVAILAAITVNIQNPTASTKTLNVLNWTSYIPNEIIEAFENEYHIEVNYSTYSSNEELLAKISSSSSGTYDLVFPSDYMVELLKTQDYLEKLDTKRLENFKNLDSRFLAQPFDPENEYSLPFLLATTVILYNSEKIEQVSSYQNLLAENLNNDLVLLDDERIMIGTFLLASGFNFNSTSDEALNIALDFYQELRTNVKAFDSDSPKTFFITDEVDAGILWNAEATLAMEYDENLEMVYPDEGFALSMDNFVILKNSQNQDNAYLFIDYLLRDDVAAKIVESYPYISPNAELSAKNDAIDEIFARGSYVENIDRAATKKLDKLWAKIKN